MVDKDGIKLVEGPQKTFIVGFYLKSILSLAKHLLQRDYNTFDYLQTYCFSQDILETFFGKIQSRHGWKNNLNSLQLQKKSVDSLQDCQFCGR